MTLTRRHALWFALCTAAACAGRSGGGAEAEPGGQPLAGAFVGPPAERRAAIASLVGAARPRVFVEVMPREPIEAQFGGLLPIGLDDFELVRVVVEQDVDGVGVDPVVALVPEVEGAAPLPMFAPTRDLFIAFTGERRAGKHTRYRLKSAGLPWVINLLTVGVLELVTVELEGVPVQPDEAAHDRAAPRAARLARLISPPHGCAWGRSPCDRYLVVPRQRDEVPLRLELDLRLEAGGRALRLAWSAPLPAGKPLGARLDAVFHGAPIVLEPASAAAVDGSAPTIAGCRLSEPLCASVTTARAARAAAPPEPPVTPPPARLATPAESRAARPRWVADDGYAPGTTIDAPAPAELVAGGPLREVLLVCDLAGVATAGTLVVEARAGATPAHRPPVYAHEGRPRFVVPLVTLDPGEALAVSVWRRSSSWFWGTQEVLLGRVSAEYRGALPLARGGRGVTVSCVALGREGIEARVAPRLAALARALVEFDIGVDPIVERAADWGIGGWGMGELRRRVEAIAGLVGWSDPRIVALLPALDHYRDVFYRHLGRLLAARREQLPAPGTLLSFKKGDLRVVGSVCGAAIDRKRVLWAREKVAPDGCVTVVEVVGRGPAALEASPRTGSLGAVWSLELAWADGRRSDAWAVGVEPPAGRHDPERLRLAAGEAARFYLAPREPYHREGELGPLFLLALDGIEPVSIRLR